MEISGKNLEGSLRDYYKFRATKKKTYNKQNLFFLIKKCDHKINKINKKITKNRSKNNND